MSIAHHALGVSRIERLSEPTGRSLLEIRRLKQLEEENANQQATQYELPRLLIPSIVVLRRLPAADRPRVSHGNVRPSRTFEED